MKLVPYAGSEQPPPRRISPSDRRAVLLANIMVRQKQGKLLSEIGVEFGSLHTVRAAMLCWLFEVPA